MLMPRVWTIVTGEYPPQNGGVSDYVRIVAEELVAAGDTVNVWAPTTTAAQQPVGHASRVRVRRLPDHFGSRSLALLDRKVKDTNDHAAILVQYVPHAFGFKAMNLAFCHWLLELGRRREVWTMFHEVAFPVSWDQSLRHNMLGGVNRLMAMMVARASRRIFVAIPAWADLLRPLARAGQTFEWMPIPSNIPTRVAVKDMIDIRVKHGLVDGDLLIGHFGTYSPVVSGSLAESILALLLSKPHRHAMFVGRGGAEFAGKLISEHPELASRLHALGGAPPEVVSIHLAACDVLVQPYPDGVSCRRGSTMAGLALGLPIVTNLGHLSEPIWEQTGAVALAASPDVHAFIKVAEQLLNDPIQRSTLVARARQLYVDKFDVRWTIKTLRGETIPYREEVLV